MKSWRSLVGQVLDVLVNQHELGQRGDVEARAGLVERAHDLRRGIGLHGVVGLHLGQMPPEARVVPADHVVVDHHDRRAVLPRESHQLFLSHQSSAGSEPSTIFTLLWAKYSRVSAFIIAPRWS